MMHHDGGEKKIIIRPDTFDDDTDTLSRAMMTTDDD